MNDQRQVIFSQRLNILKQLDIHEMLKDFLNELSQKMLKIKNDFKTSNDQKTFLARVKNLTGNVINDENLIKYGNLKDEEFLKKITEIFDKKREEKVKLIGADQYKDLEKDFFANFRLFMESSSTIFGTAKTSNRIEKLRPKRSFI